MGLAMGYTVATPAVMSLLKSCKTENAETWTPQFFTPEEGSAIKKLVDVLLPKTDTPSASELGLHKFLDIYSEKVMTLGDQKILKNIMSSFFNHAQKLANVKSPETLDKEHLEHALSSSLEVLKKIESDKTYDDDIWSWKNRDLKMEREGSFDPSTLEDNIAAAIFADNFRGITIWAYKNTEYVGEEVLPYASVPGEYIACADVNELTGGKVWSPQR